MGVGLCVEPLASIGISLSLSIRVLPFLLLFLAGFLFVFASLLLYL